MIKEIKNTDINPYITYAVEFFIFIAKQKSPALDERPKRCYNQSIAAGF